MIDQLERAEQSFRKIFNEKMKLTGLNVNEERLKLDRFFRNPRLDPNKLNEWHETVIKARNEYLHSKFVDLKKLEFDLKLNKFEAANHSLSTYSNLGRLSLFKFFYPNKLAIHHDATNDVIIYDFNKNSMEKHLVGHMNEITCLAPYGTAKLISASADFSIKIWNLVKCQCENTLRGHTKRINCLKILEYQWNSQQVIEYFSIFNCYLYFFVEHYSLMNLETIIFRH